MIPGMFAERKSGGRVRCNLCPHACLLNEGQRGICGVRKNAGGVLYSLNSDKITAVHSDPIEKKPLYHFLPGSDSLSIAAMGCNFRCGFCQNHSISMVDGEGGIAGEDLKPDDIIHAAIRGGAASISYTYTEPTVFFELMFTTAKAAKEAGLKNVMVSNGYISGEALETIIPYMDGANIDLKSYSEEFYTVQCGGRLAPVLDTIIRLNHSPCWIELTTLMIPGLNTSEKEIEMITSFIAETNTEIPWHVSRFFPRFKAGDRQPTDPGMIEGVLDTAEKNGLKYVYGGNFNSGKWGETRCHECGKTLIKRRGYDTDVEGLSAGKCVKCRTEIPGVWT